MKRLVVLGCLLGALAVLSSRWVASAADTGGRAAAMEALKEFNDYVGEYKASGAPARRDPKGEWSEVINWGWRFKGDDAWMVMEVKKGKYFKTGELRYLADKKLYRFTATDAAGQSTTFEGKVSPTGYLMLERTDSKTKELQQIRMSSNNDGARFIYEYWSRPQGRTQIAKAYQVAGSKEGESIGAKEKKPECVVSGGIGTMAIAYNGKTYYVCCSGCRDAFNENPAKYVKEFEAKQKNK